MHKVFASSIAIALVLGPLGCGGGGTPGDVNAARTPDSGRASDAAGADALAAMDAPATDDDAGGTTDDGGGTADDGGTVADDGGTVPDDAGPPAVDGGRD